MTLSSNEAALIRDASPTSPASINGTVIPTPTLALTPNTSMGGEAVLTTTHQIPQIGSTTGWQVLDTFGGGGLTGLATHPTDPKIVYIASDNGGLFKTDNGGDTWFSVTSNMGAYRLGFVTLDPLNPEIIYVTAATDFGLDVRGGATGEIYRSLNGGQSWQFISGEMGFQNSFPSQIALYIPFDPATLGRFDQDGDRISDIILAAAWTGPADPPVGGIWRSEDEGQTFIQEAFPDKNMTAIRAFSGNPNLVFATNYEGEIYRSDDLAHTWTSIKNGLPLTDIADLAIHPTDPDILYVTCRWCVADEAPVWKTLDGGQTWVPASAGLDTKVLEGFPRILIDRHDSETLYVTIFGAESAHSGVYKTTDGGLYWSPMPLRLTLPDGRPFVVDDLDRSMTIAQAIDGTLFSSGDGAWRYPDGDPDDGHAVWEPATLGVGNVHVNVIEPDPQNPAILYQGISDYGPYKSIDGGSSFHRILGNGWPVTVANYSVSGPYYRNYKHCSLACSSTCDSRGAIWGGGTTDFVISRQDSNVVYSAFGSGSGNSRHGGVNKSIDGGATWEPVGFQLEAGFELNPDTCVPYGFTDLAIDQNDDHVVYAVQAIPPRKLSILYKTDDGGASWTRLLTTDTYITGFQVSEIDPALVVVSTLRAVFQSVESGLPDSWQEITPSDATRILAVALSPHQLGVIVVGTNTEGFYYTADGGQTWMQNRLEDLFEQRLSQGSELFLEADIATAINPDRAMIGNISAFAFDPNLPDTFYIAGRQHTRASFGVAKITNAGQTWERLPLTGLSPRNVYDLSIDKTGKYLYAGTFNGTYRLQLR